LQLLSRDSTATGKVKRAKEIHSTPKSAAKHQEVLLTSLEAAANFAPSVSSSPPLKIIQNSKIRVMFYSRAVFGSF
jgi:hypothetical protein